MTGPAHGVGRYNKLAVNPETVFGTDPVGYPVATDYLRIITASLSGARPRQAREDANGSAGKDGSIDMKGTAEVQVEAYMLNSGTAATAPDWADLLLTCGGFTAIASTNTAISGTISGAGVINVDDASVTSVGGCITVAGELRYVTAIDTGASPETITVTPDFNTAPGTAGVVVYGGITYAPNSDSDTTPNGATLYLSNNAQQVRIQGAYATAFTVTLGGTDAGRIQMTITGRSFDYRGTGDLTAAVNSVVTTIPVTNGGIVPADVSATNPYYFTISAGLAAVEFVQVTGVSGNDLTVVRNSPSGSASAGHLDNAIIEPYQPTPTYSGSPVPSTGGDLIVAGSTTKASSATFAYDFGRLPRENAHGDAWVVCGYSNGMRTMTSTYEAFSDIATSGIAVQTAYNRTSSTVMTTQGEATGAIIGAYSPAIYISVPEFGFSSEDMKWSMTGEANTSAVGADDECVFMHG